ncbi:hypothetical protein [Meiothermus taiwanensis]|jgi:hypothetical protein|uniref:DUF4911 domain-containing protein n=1 Tax=Meiothermus taiwanensis WR-220 TaxID=1339250 RepID=A0ABM6WJY7_9DEIN|nr:hypothetical protein [Meiothermus taiwanensis]AWR87455.1 hypothetical protein Mtai_v1c22240 [Meiothermus taiwanensis WR-220]KIQ55907.1 hypothetical protein SY28_00540 [Meiothermus taiwanensis]KZK16073.1 hypothetical protein A3962_07880 [Meiothermus taiwanensis]
MSNNRSFLLQLWQDQGGVWVVLKDEVCGLLYQFESLEALIHFLAQTTGFSPQAHAIKEAARGAPGENNPQ